MSETLEAPVQAQPQVKSGAAPYLHPSDATAACAFYEKAFAAQVVSRMPAQDGKRLMHAHLYINDASVMMSDCFPEHGFPVQVPAGFQIHLHVDDADAWWTRAVEAGCTIAMPIQDQFWGDRYGELTDPFGYRWSIGAPAKKG
jgi:uncharacterized glyoxalase superfamily protein PhnB